MKLLSKKVEPTDYNQISYHQKEVKLYADPLLLVGKLAESNLSETFVTYEDHGKWFIAIGEAATVVTDDCKTTLTVNGQTQHWQTEVPLESTQEAFAKLPINDWKAYGIANFSLARKNHNLEINETEKELIRFFVPIYEIRIQEDKFLLRAIDEYKLQELSTLIFSIDSTIIKEKKDPFSEQINQKSLDISSIENFGIKDYLDKVAIAIKEIGEDQYRKVILSRDIPIAQKIDIVATYITGRKGNTPARSFLLKLNGLEVAGFSPETVLIVDNQGWIHTRPLAGTRSLGKCQKEEQKLREELLSDSKEISEHAISVQLAIAELNEVCTEGTVSISDFMGIVRRKSVQHIASTVRGHLAEGKSSWQALHAVFPGVTATGIPKRKAIDAIGRLEPKPRQLYSGCVLTLDSNGMMDAAIVLRSVFQKNEKGWLQVGAGIVKNSSPEREMEETREKVRSIAQFLVNTD